MTRPIEITWGICRDPRAHEDHIRLQEIGDAMAADMKAMRVELAKAREALRFAASMTTSDEHTSDEPHDAEMALDKVIITAREALDLCRRCGTRMSPGKATGQTYVGGSLDFPFDPAPVTMSAGGPGKLIDCMKCPKCGWSVSK